MLLQPLKRPVPGIVQRPQFYVSYFRLLMKPSSQSYAVSLGNGATSGASDVKAIHTTSNCQLSFFYKINQLIPKSKLGFIRKWDIQIEIGEETHLLKFLKSQLLA